MFNNKLVMLTTGPSVFSPEIKLMIENYFGGIHTYVNSDKPEDLDFFVEHGDALVLAGGSDIFRGTLGESVVRGEGLSKFDILRDKREIYLYEKFIELNKPILAICRGFQLLCAKKFGMWLLPDIGGDICHSAGEIKINLEAGEFMHYINCLPKYKKAYFDNKTPVNSYHHQGIVASKTQLEIVLENASLDVVAFAPNSTDKDNNINIVEIVESEENKIVGCQFHPEADWMYGNEASLKVLSRFKSFLPKAND